MKEIVKLTLLLACFFVTSIGLEAVEHQRPGIVIRHNIPANHKGPRIALITFISNTKNAHISEDYHPYSKTVKFGTRSKKLYCQKHGYDFIIGSKKIYECDGHLAPNKDKLAIHWMKVPMLARFLPKYDWVVWTDADSIFLNPKISLESLLDDSYDVLFGTFSLADQARGTGHIFVKNTQWSRTFLNEWWSYSEEKKEGQWDLERLNDMLGSKSLEYMKHLKSLPTKLTDLSAAEYKSGDFIVHFYSYHGKDLYKIFKVFEKRYGHIIGNLEKEVRKRSVPR